MSDTERADLFRALLPKLYEYGNIQRLKRTDETEPILVQLLTDAFEVGMKYQQDLASTGTLQQDS
jgi:hypothetical protein